MLIPEKLPPGLVFEEVMLLSAGRDRNYSGRAAVKRWTAREAFFRGMKKASKIAFVLLVVPLPLAFIEPFLFLIWGGVLGFLLITVVGPLLHFIYAREGASFFFVEGRCPRCETEGRLKPFVSTAYSDPFVVLCEACGQNSDVTISQSARPEIPATV